MHKKGTKELKISEREGGKNLKVRKRPIPRGRNQTENARPSRVRHRDSNETDKKQRKSNSVVNGKRDRGHVREPANRGITFKLRRAGKDSNLPSPSSYTQSAKKPKKISNNRGGEARQRKSAEAGGKDKDRDERLSSPDRGRKGRGRRRICHMIGVRKRKTHSPVCWLNMGRPTI